MTNDIGLVGLFADLGRADEILTRLPEGFLAVSRHVALDGDEAVPVIEIKAQIEEDGEAHVVFGLMRLSDARSLHAMLGREIKAVTGMAKEVQNRIAAARDMGGEG